MSGYILCVALGFLARYLYDRFGSKLPAPFKPPVPAVEKAKTIPVTQSGQTGPSTPKEAQKEAQNASASTSAAGADLPAVDFLHWLLLVRSGRVNLDRFDREVLSQIEKALPVDSPKEVPVDSPAPTPASSETSK